MDDKEQILAEELEKAYRAIYRKLYLKNYYNNKRNELKKKALINYFKNRNDEHQSIEGLKIIRKSVELNLNLN